MQCVKYPLLLHTIIHPELNASAQNSYVRHDKQRGRKWRAASGGDGVHQHPNNIAHFNTQTQFIAWLMVSDGRIIHSNGKSYIVNTYPVSSVCVFVCDCGLYGWCLSPFTFNSCAWMQYSSRKQTIGDLLKHTGNSTIRNHIFLYTNRSSTFYTNASCFFPRWMFFVIYSLLFYRVCWCNVLQSTMHTP